MIINSIISAFRKQKDSHTNKFQFDENGNRDGYWDVQYYRGTDNHTYYSKGNYVKGMRVGYWEIDLPNDCCKEYYL
jgi:hypothetical protein